MAGLSGGAFSETALSQQGVFVPRFLARMAFLTNGCIFNSSSVFLNWPQLENNLFPHVDRAFSMRSNRHAAAWLVSKCRIYNRSK